MYSALALCFILSLQPFMIAFFELPVMIKKRQAGRKEGREEGRITG